MFKLHFFFYTKLTIDFLKKFYFLVSACLMVWGTATAQGKKQNALSVEIGKTGAIFNVTYDRKSETAKVGLRAIAGSNFGSHINVVNVGGGAYYLAGKSVNSLELGTDILYLHVNVDSEDFRSGNLVAPAYNTRTLFTSFNIGYRHTGRNTLFRVGIAPGFTKQEWLPGGYLSYGVRL